MAWRDKKSTAVFMGSSPKDTLNNQIVKRCLIVVNLDTAV